MIKIQIKSVVGKLLFEYESDDNTIKNTIEKAVESGADLSSADLSGTYLRGAVLGGAVLSGAVLRGAEMMGSYLMGAFLSGVILSGADMRGVDLMGADMRGVDLSDVDLKGADMRRVDLRGAILRGTDLRGADLSDAYLMDADLMGEKIKTAAVFMGLYHYIVIPYITENDVRRIKMGCYDRTLQEWESDFWNNPNEFPNNNSVQSNLRLMAFETAKKWFEIISDEHPKT